MEGRQAMIRRITAAAFTLVFLITLDSSARADPLAVNRATSAGPLRQSIARIQGQADAAGREAIQPFLPRPRPRLSARQRAFIGIGVLAGFFGGGILGAKIEGNSCHCDDPGLQGFLIGAPIGAVAGGIVGAILADR
jgi:hypothetical protein